MTNHRVRLRACGAALTVSLTLPLTLPLALALALPVVLASAPVRAAGATVLPTGAVMVRDDLQRDITLLHPPQRIISMLPSLTETVCALGACERLVATDRYSDWPEQVRRLPKTGGLNDAQIELIVSLHPDLVLLARSQRVTERLGQLGIVTFALDTDTYADIERTTRLIGALLGVSARATALSSTIENQVSKVAAQSRARVQGRAHGAGPSVYFELDPTPYAAGPSSFIGELLTRLGARNIVTPGLGAYAKLNPEYVVQQDPDVIFVSPTEIEALPKRPGWDHLRAVRERRLCSFPSKVEWEIMRPGPRVAEGMSVIAECLARMAPK